MKELAKASMDVNQPDSKGKLPLVEAVRIKEPRFVDALIQYGAFAKAKDPATGTSPIHLSFQQNMPLVGVVLSPGQGQPGAPGGTLPLRQGGNRGHMAAHMAALLLSLKEGVQWRPNCLLLLNLLQSSRLRACGLSCVCETFTSCCLQVSRILLAYGADINVEDKSGKKVRTPAAAPMGIGVPGLGGVARG